MGLGPGRARAATTLKLSHQFPGGTIDEGDFRDRLCRMFAAEVGERTKGALEVQVYPGSSLMKTNAQFSAMRKGALDMSLLPLAYAGGEVPETEHRPDAGARHLLRAGHRLEEGAGRQASSTEILDEQGHRAGVAGSGRRAAWPAASSRWSPRATPRA